MEGQKNLNYTKQHPKIQFLSEGRQPGPHVYFPPLTSVTLQIIRLYCPILEFNEKVEYVFL